MTVAHEPPIYSELLDLLAESADPARVLKFRLSKQQQTKLDDLLVKNRAGSLSETEAAELAAFEQFEHVVRLLKARLLQARSP